MIAVMPAFFRVAGSHGLEVLAWSGSILGVGVTAAGATFCWSAPAPSMAVLGCPPPDVMTAYAVALCGIGVTVANSVLAIYQRYRRGKIEAATLEAAKLEAVARLVSARLKAGQAARRRRPRKPAPGPPASIQES